MSDVKLVRQVDEGIHSAILEFDPALPETYHGRVANLKKLQSVVEDSDASQRTKNSLLARLKSQLAFMAYGVKDYREAEKLTSEVMRLAVSGDPNFETAVLLRTDLLHILERHEEEVQGALESVESHTVIGSAVISLLAKVAGRHSDRIDWRASLIWPIKAYVSEVPELARLFKDSSLSEENPAAYVIAVASVNRQLSLARTKKILGEASEE